ncbi:MAG: TPM domain-containing protein [Aristaeellaceae bacterium]
MKQILRAIVCLALACVLTASAALAAPRYPASQGSVTDAAAVLSAAVVTDLTEAAGRLEKAAGVTLTVATVDFLDGASLQSYGEGLRAAWSLDDDDLLLLLCVGEDLFGLFPGRDVTSRLPSATQQKLLSAYLETPFLQQDYDGALRAFVPALIAECAKAWRTEVDLSGLLGTPAATAAPLSVDDWLHRRGDEPEATSSPARRVTEEDEDSGLSLGKVILTVFLLMIIFGNRGHRRRRGRWNDRRGCGCMPFSSILAALGLWKLWDRD